MRQEFSANAQRAQVIAEIEALVCGAADARKGAEVVGLLPIQDRLHDLRKRLAQIENLIGAAGNDAHESERAWSSELGDPFPLGVPAAGRVAVNESPELRNEGPNI